MATRNETHVHDLSTLANFKDWAQAIHNAFIAFGWTNSSDTGQVNWTSIASVPTSGNSVFEIFQPGDALTTFYVRIDYANSGGSSPQIKIQVGTGTNGSGTLTGTTTTQIISCTATNSGSTLFNCLFCGTSGSFECMMWREATSAFNVAFGIERSKDSSGNDTSTYITVFGCGFSNASSANMCQQSIVFGVGATSFMTASSPRSWYSIITGNYGAVSLAFNGNTAISPVFPMVGYWDNPHLCFAKGSVNDFTELAMINPTVYGSTHTFVYSKNQNFAHEQGSAAGIFMRWE